MPPASAISASATSIPPSETSWTAVTLPSAISCADEFAVRALAVEIDRRRRAVFAAMEFAQPQRLAEMADCDLADQTKIASPSALNPIVAIFS